MGGSTRERLVEHNQQLVHLVVEKIGARVCTNMPGREIMSFFFLFLFFLRFAVSKE